MTSSATTVRAPTSSIASRSTTRPASKAGWRRIDPAPIIHDRLSPHKSRSVVFSRRKYRSIDERFGAAIILDRRTCPGAERSTMKTSGNTILMTGGGSGIGEALAHRFHDRGDTVIIVGRRPEALQQAAKGRDRIHIMTLDVEDAEAVDAFADKVVADFPSLNVLFNNAGIMMFEDLTKRRSLVDAEATLAINVLGPIRLTNALIDHLTGQPDAAIVTVTSGLAYVPLVAAPTYSATKAAIHSYTVSLRTQLAGKVEVIELAPPGVQTDLTPGQANRPGYMPLDAFADAVAAQFGRQSTPPEILVDEVQFLRQAEREGRFDETLKTLTERAAKQREEGNRQR
ncbi:SDR family oxidoreductase [Sphingomonas sp. 1P08PE]|uniref:SDR family oxidoreductase n=1 Tax=Sphingomonas sp. 1P08PE TaxID=554122 RepID=UPI0039A3A5C5